MTINTKYNFEDNLYFLHDSKILYRRPVSVTVTSMNAVIDDTGRFDTVQQFNLIRYCFQLEEGKGKFVDKYENQVFKRRADLIKSLQ